MTLRPALAALPLAALLLAGCASPLAGKPADLATRQVLRENLQHASYNFNGELGFTSLHGSRADEAKPQLSYLINQIARSTKMTFSGAIDQTGKRMELIPAVRFERRNLQASLSIPLELNLQDFSLLVDPAAFDLFVPELYSEQPRFVRFKLKPELARKIPVDAMLQALPTLLDEGYAAVDKQVFTLETLDATAQQLGASYQLRIAMSQQQESQILLHVIDGLAKLVRQQAEHEGRAEDSKQLNSMLLLLHTITQQPASELQGSRAISHLYANRQGQLLGINQEITLDTPQMHGLAYLHLRNSNHGKPVFVYQPGAGDIIDFEQLPKPQWLRDLAK